MKARPTPLNNLWRTKFASTTEKRHLKTQTKDTNTISYGLPVEFDCKNPDCQETDPLATHKHRRGAELGTVAEGSPSYWPRQDLNLRPLVFRSDAGILTTCQCHLITQSDP